MKYRVDIATANKAKSDLSTFIDGKDNRLLNKVGAFASLFSLDLSRFKEPVLVLKTEEPGSKQVLAFQQDRIESVCFDMIHHLINDCIVMGAEPLAVQDLIVCGKMDPGIVKRVVSACAAACQAQGCVLTGGETTEQPDVVPSGTYILGSSIVGIVERSRIIDGSKIRAGDVVIGVGSSGLHTNGYTLIRDLLARNERLAEKCVGQITFLDAVLEPHRCYYQSLKGLFEAESLRGLAHITGGGVKENLNRILPANVDAEIDLSAYRVPEIFSVIKQESRLSDDDMLHTFNMGVGLIAVCSPDLASDVLGHLNDSSESAYVVGSIVKGTGRVRCKDTLRYPGA
ncbi:MAG: phosphoribosylformylglycinamidine cyclo-ligase [Thermodesulfobacteriota bacterium]